MGNMFQFKRDFEKKYNKSSDFELNRFLNPSLLLFNEFLTRNKDLISVE